VDVQAPGHPLLRLMRVSVDRQAGTVTAGLLGVFGRSVAAAREGLGCASVPDGNVAAAKAISAPAQALAPEPAPDPDGLWPQGVRVEPSQDPELAQVLDDAAFTGPGMRAVVVVSNGRIVGERYGAGFSEATPLLGWSMTKTVNAAIVGTLVKDRRMALDRTGLFPAWQADGRAAISLADLMAMSSGLAFNEDYGDVTDVTRMLFLEPDMAGFAADKPLTILESVPGLTFPFFVHMMNQMKAEAEKLGGITGDKALAWPRQALFSPLGMESAVLETDEHGTYVGSSYLYATARDWARFGQFLLQDGVWNGNAILPEGFVAWMREPAPASNGVYAQGQLWIEAPGDEGSPGAGVAAGLPQDIFWLEGHDGQTVAVIPSRQVVVVRMGLTPGKLGYRPQKLVRALLEALPQQ